RRETVRGPYTVWLHDPELMDKVSVISNYFRFDCELPVKLREFGILVTARYWDAQYSWNAHVDKAVAAGISEDVIRDLAANKKPHFKVDDERVFYEFAMEVLENHFVSAKTFAQAKAIFGTKGVVDLIGAVGYFSMLQICLNSAEVDLQSDREPPFADVRGFKKISA
ncbi:MAG TPA: carboxymuconolactone decarboxylase family protein, partial [Burkholderiales bacterium]